MANRIREPQNRFPPGKEPVGRIDRAMQVRVHMKPSRAMNLGETYAVEPSSVNEFSILDLVPLSRPRYRHVRNKIESDEAER